MNNLKLFSLYLTRFVNRYLVKILAYGAVFLLILFIIFQIWKRNETNISCSVISEGVIGVYNQANLPTTITSLLSASLFTLDKSGKPVPNLVENVSATDGNTVYVLTLKKNLFWSDGTPVKSTDISINLPDSEVTYTDDFTIRYKLADTFTPFLTLLTQPVLKPGTIIGLGKYKVSRQETNKNFISKLILEPVDKNKCAENPYLNIRFYPDEQTAKTAFNLGEIDVILNIQDPGGLNQQPNVVNKKIQNYSKLLAVFFNTKDPILDKNFRKALSAATSVIANEDTAKTAIAPVSWAFNSDLKSVHGDPETAKTYLSKVEAGKDKPVILTTTPIFNQLAEKIVSDWKNIGINAVVRVESGMPQNFQALLTTVTIPHDPDQYTLWHSTQNSTNLSKYSSPRADKDLEDGRKIDDMEKRKEKYWDFQKMLSDDAPAIFLYFPKTNVIYRKKVEENLNKVLNLQIPGL